MNTVAAIILAAGESRRMGVPKALLDLGGKSFIRHIIQLLHSSKIEKIVVVLGADAKKIESELVGLDVVTVINENYANGQLSSIVKGLEVAAALHLAGILICPVDHPNVSTSMYRALVEAFLRSPSSIVLPTFRGRRGHPVVFPAGLFDELKNAPPDLGARHVVRAHAAEVLEVETEDQGVLDNIDTWEDYKRLQSRLQHASRGETPKLLSMVDGIIISREL